MIVDHRTYTIYPGKTPTFTKIYEEFGYPLQQQYLGDCIGWYVSMDIGDLNQIVHLWRYKDLSDRAERRAREVAEKILEAVYASGSADALVLHLNIASFIGSADQRFNVLENLIKTALDVQSRMDAHVHFALVLRSDGSLEADERKRADRNQALALGIPVFDEIPEVARALARVSFYEKFLATHQP